MLEQLRAQVCGVQAIDQVNPFLPTPITKQFAFMWNRQYSFQFCYRNMLPLPYVIIQPEEIYHHIPFFLSPNLIPNWIISLHLHCLSLLRHHCHLQTTLLLIDGIIMQTKTERMFYLSNCISLSIVLGTAGSFTAGKGVNCQKLAEWQFGNIKQKA